MLTPFFSKILESVCPFRKKINSSIIPLKNTFLVVNNGNLLLISNSKLFPNNEYVTPFLVCLQSPL